MKYEVWLKEWLENYVKSSVKEKTYARYRDIVENQLYRGVGEYELCELTPRILQSQVTRLLESGNRKTGKGLSPSTVNAIVTVMQGSLEVAFSLGYISEELAGKIKRPRAREKQVTCFSLSEQKTIEEAVLCGGKTRMYGILICLYTGLRIGELLALEWTDVDFARREINVNKTSFEVVDKEGIFRRITGDPKTYSSVRVVPVPRALVPALTEMRRRESGRFVVSSGDRPTAIRSYQRSFEALLRRLGIGHKGFHALRHTFATRALEAGMDVKTLSEILGHKNANVTLQRYAHSMPEHKREMMDRVGNML